MGGGQVGGDEDGEGGDLGGGGKEIGDHDDAEAGGVGGADAGVGILERVARAGIDAAHQGNLAKAHAAFAKAVSLAPQISATHAALGSVCLEEGQFELADKELNKAYGLWNHDPDWQQHPQQYQPYDFTAFQKDWGPQNEDYGQMHSHQLFIAHRVGNGVVIGLYINGVKKPLFLRVDNKAKTIGFSPVELSREP